MTTFRSEAREYRVTWQRQGMGRPKWRLLQSERAARRLALMLQGRVAEALGVDPEDGCYHCDYTRSVADCAAQQHERFPPLIFGPRIESRPVGEWEQVSEEAPEDREPWSVDENGWAISPAELAARNEPCGPVGIGVEFDGIPF